MPVTPTPLSTLALRRRRNTRFRKSCIPANRPRSTRWSRFPANRRVMLLGPFGEPLATTGTVAAEMPFRFSTHYTDQETGLVYAKRRYYSPTTGRWLSRDPIEEQGGSNLYAYVSNRSVHRFDPFGLFDPRTGSIYDLELEWLAGTLPGTVSFGDGDLMTEQMKNAPELSEVLGDFIRELQMKQCGRPIAPKYFGRQLGAFSNWQHVKYAVLGNPITGLAAPFLNPWMDESVFYDFVHNPAHAFLGSWDGDAYLTRVDCCKGIAYFNLHIYDRIGVGSQTHIPNFLGDYIEMREDVPVTAPMGTPRRTVKVDFWFTTIMRFWPLDEDKKNGIRTFPAYRGTVPNLRP